MATIAKSVRKLASNMEQTVSDLAEERNRFSTVLEGMDTGVMSLNREHVITMANPSAQELLSPKQPLIGLPLSDVLKTDSFHDLVKEAWTLGSSVREIELAGPTRRIIRVHGTANESADTLILVMDEITQLKTLETVREDFVANVSHELRTPVSIIQGSAENLMDGALDDREDAERFTETILRNSRRLSVLIRDLLELSRLDSGTTQLESQAVSVGSIAEAVSSNFEARCSRHHIQLELDLDPSHIVRSDPRALEQVLTNLVENAVKYGASPGHIQIRSQALESSVQIAVIDDGPGIAHSH